MRPEGRKKITGGNSWKRDVHPHPKHFFINWWEDIADLIPRSMRKQKFKEQIKDLENEETV